MMDMAEGRVPPFDGEAELSILGSVMFSEARAREILGMLEPEHFYNEANRRIFSSMVALVKVYSPIDHVTLAEQLKRAGDLEKIGGAISLSRLTDNVATVANVEYHAKIVKQKYAIRQMIYAANEVVARGFSDSEDAETYLNDSRALITEAAGSFISGVGPQHIDDDLMQLIRDLETGEEPKGIIKSGLLGFDRATGGFWPALLYVIASRPSMGKSAFALNVAMNAALSGKKVLYVTLEDVRKYIAARLLARFADVDLRDITLHRKLDADAWTRIIQAANKIAGKKPIWVEDVAGLTSKAIVQRAATLQQTKGLDFVVVDHLGEVADKGEIRRHVLEDACKTFRDGAKEQDVPYLVLHQLNRGVEHRADKTPTMSDLNECGQIEAIARWIGFLMRPGYYESDGAGRHDTQLICAKATHGKTGMIRLWSELSRMYFRTWEANRDGLFPGDSSEEEARQSARDRGSEHDRQRDMFSGGADAQRNWEERNEDNDDPRNY